MAKLLVIEDEHVLAKNIGRYLEQQGHTVQITHSGIEGLIAATQQLPALTILDYQLPDQNGLQLIAELRQLDPMMRIIMITGHGNINLAVEVMKAGAMDLLTKPLSLSTLHAAIERGLGQRAHQNAFGPGSPPMHPDTQALLGQSPRMQAVRELTQSIAQAEPTDGHPPPPVLIQGETGTGKELVARACHYAGPRTARPFIELNCANLPAHLMEDELFGHEKGAFTDARGKKIGLIEAADGGTLFLDEIGELELGLQAKLLRVLERQSIRPLGAVRETPVNVRFVAATNRDLAAEVQAGRFREDLLYRLSVFQIVLPPLRERAEDIPQLAQHFLRLIAQRYGKTPMLLSEDATHKLLQHHWPGNVRELRNCLERAALTQRQTTLTSAHLHLVAPATTPLPTRRAATAPVSLDDMERLHLLQALQQHQWNVSMAARTLEVSRDTLRYRMAKHGLSRATKSDN